MKCELTDDFTENSLLVKNQPDSGIYYFMEEFSYECIFGYIKMENRPISCLADNSWTFTPSCVQTGKINFSYLLNN